MLVTLVIVLSVFDRSFAQAPDDADPFCTETLPGNGINILDYAPEVRPLMDSRHYQNLLPPHMNPVWQRVDNDNNNPSGTKVINYRTPSVFGRASAEVVQLRKWA